MKMKYLDNRPIIRLFNHKEVLIEIFGIQIGLRRRTHRISFAKVTRSCCRVVQASPSQCARRPGLLLRCDPIRLYLLQNANQDDIWCGKDFQHNQWEWSPVVMTKRKSDHRRWRKCSDMTWQPWTIFSSSLPSTLPRALSVTSPRNRSWRNSWYKTLLIWFQPNWKQFSSWKSYPAPISGPLGLLWHRSFCLAGPHCLLHVWGW